MAERNVSQLVRKHHCQGGFVRQYVEQSAAENDGVSYGERLERSGEQNSASNLGLNVQVVGDFEVIHDGFEDLRDLACGR